MATILVVDDEFDLRFVLRMFLEKRGHLVIEAPEGGAALEHIREATRSPDLIVTDLDMPGVDGRTFIRHLREDDATAAIPIVVWSGQPDADLDADLIFSKSTPVSTLVDELSRYCDGP